MKIQPIHIIAIQWGNVYDEEDIHRLYRMIKANTSFPIKFHLFSNESLPLLDTNITKHAEPLLHAHDQIEHLNYRKEVGLCDNALGQLQGERVFFFDLDILIIGNLDELFTYPKDNQFYIIKDWNTRGNHIGQASCYSFVVGTLGYIKKAFETDHEIVINQFGTASQEYLSYMIIEKNKSLNFWPSKWFKSFKYHCLPNPMLRHIFTPTLPPKDTLVLAFHGNPNIQDAILGRWSPPTAKKAAKGWKKLYKTCRPTKWIKDYILENV